MSQRSRVKAEIFLSQDSKQLSDKCSAVFLLLQHWNKVISTAGVSIFSSFLSLSLQDNDMRFIAFILQWCGNGITVTWVQYRVPLERVITVTFIQQSIRWDCVAGYVAALRNCLENGLIFISCRVVWGKQDLRWWGERNGQLMSDMGHALSVDTVTSVHSQPCWEQTQCKIATM